MCRITKIIFEDCNHIKLNMNYRVDRREGLDPEDGIWETSRFFHKETGYYDEVIQSPKLQELVIDLGIPIYVQRKQSRCDKDKDRRESRCDGNNIWKLDPSCKYKGESDVLEFDKDHKFLWYSYAKRNERGEMIKGTWKPN